jgi:Acetyltransferase (GNAT) family
MLTVRTASKGDAAATMHVHREAVFAKAAGYYPRAVLEAWAPGDTADRVARIAREIVDPDFIAVVAEAGGDIIGFAMAVPSRGELRAVYVKPNLVGQVGRALLAEIERRAFARTPRLPATHRSTPRHSTRPTATGRSAGRAASFVGASPSPACE